MLARIRKALEDKERGFTLIELLVVVIIIGILAAIAIPTFLSQRTKGWEAAAKAEVRNVATAEESFATDNGGVYTKDVAQLELQGFNSSPDIDLSFATTQPTGGFTVCAKHKNGGSMYKLSTLASSATANDAGAPVKVSSCA